MSSSPMVFPLVRPCVLLVRVCPFFFSLCVCVCVCVCVCMCTCTRGYRPCFVWYGTTPLLPSSDGATIVQSLRRQGGPVWQSLVQLSVLQDQEYGDGTTGVILLAEALLLAGCHLLQEGVSPHHLLGGMRRASTLVHRAFDSPQHGCGVWDNPLGLRHLHPEEGGQQQLLQQVVQSSLSSKVPAHHAEFYGSLLLRWVGWVGGTLPVPPLGVVVGVALCAMREWLRRSRGFRMVGHEGNSAAATCVRVCWSGGNSSGVSLGGGLGMLPSMGWMYVGVQVL